MAGRSSAGLSRRRYTYSLVVRGASRLMTGILVVRVVADQLHRFDEDAPRTLLLRATLCVRGHHPEVSQVHPLLGTHHHHGTGHTRQRESLDVSVAIDTGEVSARR